ncbi:hypothetical protein N9854_04045 [Amylibacter sp.]|nr:hypothetical protein [Amylibacter sp.]
MGFKHKAVFRWCLIEGLWNFQLLPNVVKIAQGDAVIIATAHEDIVRAGFSGGGSLFIMWKTVN